MKYSNWLSKERRENKSENALHMCVIHHAARQLSNINDKSGLSFLHSCIDELSPIKNSTDRLRFSINRLKDALAICAKERVLPNVCSFSEITELASFLKQENGSRPALAELTIRDYRQHLIQQSNYRITEELCDSVCRFIGIETSHKPRALPDTRDDNVLRDALSFAIGPIIRWVTLLIRGIYQYTNLLFGLLYVFIACKSRQMVDGYLKRTQLQTEPTELFALSEFDQSDHQPKISSMTRQVCESISAVDNTCNMPRVTRDCQ